MQVATSDPSLLSCHLCCWRGLHDQRTMPNDVELLDIPSWYMAAAIYNVVQMQLFGRATF